uniref:hypothetical protein n=1 Tax=Streptomyces sp. FR1 TaxID=349971 RepID=UPI001564C696|nr:hypothetical protein [Streptomyces sp. FR1]
MVNKAITPEQAAVLEAEDRYVRAQVQLYEWMERAEQHQAAADYAAAPGQRTDGWERIANTHRAEADRALRFAHAWAEAAFALVPPPQPLDLIVGAEQTVRDNFAKATTRRGGPGPIIAMPEISDTDVSDAVGRAHGARE